MDKITEDQLKAWKLQLADAIIQESKVRELPIPVLGKIEHQGGIVWVGDNVVAIVTHPVH